MRSVLKNISILIVIVLLIYFTSNYAGALQSQILKMFNIPGSSVAGASTERAQEISGKIKSDIEDQFEILQKQILNLTIADTINSLSRLQKIQRDFTTLKAYNEEKINDVLKSK